MHNHTINASIQIVPVVTDKHPYEWVDEAIAVIQRSGINYEVTPFATVLEGTYDQVMNVIHAVNEYLYGRGCEEWISNLQIQIRSRDILEQMACECYKVMAVRFEPDTVSAHETANESRDLAFTGVVESGEYDRYVALNEGN